MKNLLLFIALLYTTNLTPFTFNFDPYKDRQEQFDTYVSLHQNNKLQLTAAYSTLILMLQGLTYLGDKHPQEKNMIITKYPFVQKWYDEINQKYPQAHLDQKKLIQTKHGEIPGFYNIYFSEQSIQQIDYLYKKVLEDETLTEAEQTILKQKEFLLLFQAGYIELNCFFDKNVAITTGFIATESLQIPLLKFVQEYPWLQAPVSVPSIATLPPKLQKELAPHYTQMFNSSVNWFDSCYNMLSIADLIVFILWYVPTVIKYFENKAYHFAYTQCDDQCLQAALVLYKEQNNINVVKALNNEIERRTDNQ